jgi:peptidoglycan/xylan/chitin deacetylase (PgdA/CDA1 family)
MIRIMESLVSGTSAGSPAFPGLHRPPRRPHAGAWALGASQLLVALLWWRLGWHVGLPVLLLSHAIVAWGTFRPRSALFGPVLWRLGTQERVAWVTIDDGPSDDTPAVLDLLDARGIKATFFVVADRARARPELVREMLRRGHSIGNHSAGHPAGWFWALGPKRMSREIEGAQAALTEIAGVAPRWFRAVVGFSNPFVAAPLARLGLTRVAWSARGYDAVERDPARVSARILRTLAPGAIVLLHEGSAHGRNLEIVARVLDDIAARGYRSVLPD